MTDPRSELERVIADMRSTAMVAGQASVEHLDPLMAQADARFAEYATTWADQLSAILQRSPQQEEEKDEP